MQSAISVHRSTLQFTTTTVYLEMASCVAHPNVALVKYWGKENEKEVTPIHGSLSVTVDFGKTTTIAQYSDRNEFVLNGKIETLTDRLQNVVSFFNEASNRSFSVKSSNDFPTAAGFASSASGAAAFVGALASLVGDTDDPIPYWRERNVELSVLARRVSGSGCRSIYGGFTEWPPGDSETSVPHQLFNEEHWPDLRILSVVLESQKKKTPSTSGMQRTVETVPWIHWRAREIVPDRILMGISSIRRRDFSTLSEMIMRESNELHANCAAAFPPVRYLTDDSYLVVEAIHELNKRTGKPIAAYSFDAGPSPFIFTLYENVQTVTDCLIGMSATVKAELIKTGRPAEGIKCARL
jgi:diphosphomevalonate decarboxylase